ncbi:MAG: NAD-dependent epimerase/dehydratase family protein [Candidatus Diapherotrites archaeon]|uniref:NAD-dependent epimerase/dehydratase family protein n=1 Tax=Candidatus Iainarchaeum sp. TaxID=3101447 RepID=A0A938YY26_9ARCH|nr:NAD-dependent epimerase/dehydratase family protein [Candidatus Diapherotrites archaeon]
MVEIEQLFISKDCTIKDAMLQIQKSGFGTALVVENRKLLGVVTDGDIRRAILEGTPINEKAARIMNSKPIVAGLGTTKRKLLEMMKGKEKGLEPGMYMKIPIVNEKREVVDLAVFTEIGKKKEPSPLFLTKSDVKRGKLKKILVLGGAGYLGSVLSRKLLEKKYEVRVLDNLTYGEEGISELFGKKGFEFQQGDIRNIHDVVMAVSGADAVVHLAAIVGDPACKIEPMSTIESNYLATKMVAEVCRHHLVNRFVFASTCSVYGQSETASREDSETRPLSLYARSKLDSENALLEMEDESFGPAILRLSTLFGLSPRMRFDLVVNTLTAKAIIEGKITIYGGEQYRPLLHVEDAAEAFIACIEAPIEKVSGKVFNAGSKGLNVKIIDIGNEVKKAVPHSELEISREKVDLRNYFVSFEKIEKELGFTAKKSMKDGITEIKKWIAEKKINNYWEKKYSNYEYLVNLNNGKGK